MYLKIKTIEEWNSLSDSHKNKYYNHAIGEPELCGLKRFAEIHSGIVYDDNIVDNGPIEVHQMKYPLSPLDIGVLLHCYTSPLPHPNIINIDIQNSIVMFASCDMITPIGKHDRANSRPITDVVFSTTEKGRAFINTILGTKEPVCTWLVPQQLPKPMFS